MDQWKPSLIAWETLCLPKKEGGMDIRDCKLSNTALITKISWNVVSKTDNLWVKWVS